MIELLLAAAVSFATATNDNEPTPQPILDRIESIVCSSSTKALRQYEVANRVSLPDDVWETADQCD